MNSDDLKFFSLVVESGSISAAALTGGCDASTISRRITQLEKSVGTRLFSRSGRGVTLTPQGQELLSYARQVASLIDSARAAISSTNRQGPARIRIGAQPTIAKVLFGALFHTIHNRYPSSQIHFTEGSASKVLAELQAGNIDIAVVYKPEYPGNLAYEPLLYEKLYLLTPTNSDVTAEQVRANGLAGIPLADSTQTPRLEPVQVAMFSDDASRQPGLLQRIRAQSAVFAHDYFGSTSAEYETLVVAPMLGSRAGLLGALALAQRARR